MATTKRSATRSGKSTTRAGVQRGAAGKKPRAAKSGTKTAKKRAAKPKAAAKKRAPAKPAPKKTAVKPSASKAGAGAAATAALTKKLRAEFARERTGLQQQLTEIVQEVGVLRRHEMRAMQLERQLAERDATIATLRRELEAQAQAPAPPAPDTQQGLDFSAAPAAGLDDLDETAALDDEDDLL